MVESPTSTSPGPAPSTPAASASPSRVASPIHCDHEPTRPAAPLLLDHAGDGGRGLARHAGPGSCRPGRAAGRGRRRRRRRSGRGSRRAGRRRRAPRRRRGRGPWRPVYRACVPALASPSVTQLHDLTALEQAAAVRARRGEPDRAGRARAGAGSRRSTPGSAPSSPSRRSARWPRRGRAERAAARAAASCPRCSACRPRSRTSTTPPACGRRSARRCIADFVPDRGRRRRHQAGRGRDDQPGQDQHPGVRLPLLHRQRRSSARPAARGTRARLAGGSSGGAAVAVAAGLVPVRAGQRRRRLDPHPGRASTAWSASSPAAAGSATRRYGGEVTGLGTNGPLARTVRDAAAMLDAMAGPVLGDPSWAPPLPPGETFLGCGRPAAGPAADRPLPPSRRCPAPTLEPGGRRGARRRRAAAGRARPRRGGRAGRAARPRGAAVVRAGVGAVRARRCRCRGPGRRAAAAHPRAARARAGDVARRRRWRRCSRCGCSPAASCRPTAATTSCWRRCAR